MAGSAYDRFIHSMQINYEKWHDGIGYDLDALRSLEPREKRQILQLLKTRDDWRDVEAIAVIQETPPADDETLAAKAGEALDALTHTKSGEARMTALAHLHDSGQLNDKSLETRLLEELKIVDIYDGLSRCFALLDLVPTNQIKRRLLWCMLNRTEIGTLMAGKLWQMCGKSTEELDWSQRPMLLKFGKGVHAWEAHQAAQQFCAAVGMAMEDAE